MKPNLQTLTEQLSKFSEGIHLIKEELEISIQHIIEKEAELEANENLNEDADWRELYEFEQGYLAAMKFCYELFS